MGAARVTITLPPDLVEGIDLVERNRSRFISEAMTHELARRRRAGLITAIRNPRPGLELFLGLGPTSLGGSLR